MGLHRRCLGYCDAHTPRTAPVPGQPLTCRHSVRFHLARLYQASVPLPTKRLALPRSPPRLLTQLRVRATCPSPAQIVPLCVVLPTVAAAAAVLGLWAWRSRRQQAGGKAAQGHPGQGQGGADGDLEQGAESREGGAARGAARGRLGVAGYGARGDGGCVFMGLDEGQAPPEWSEALLREVSVG